MEACKNSKRYRGLKKPTCNGGKPCKTCTRKFEAPQVTLAWGDDWEGLFINGKIVEQTHRIRLTTVLEKLSEMGLIKFEYLEADQGNLEAAGEFPETLEEAKQEGLI